ncbi:MAG: hypothetical protein ACOCPN_01700, partial [Desulfonatronovibrionaceae bacterium]
ASGLSSGWINLFCNSLALFKKKQGTPGSCFLADVKKDLEKQALGEPVPPGLYACGREAVPHANR